MGKMPFFYLPPSRSRTGEVGWPSAGGGRRRPGAGGGRGRGENREDGKGIRFPYLIWVVMACRDGSAAAGGEGWCRLMVAVLRRSRGRGRWLPRCEARWGAAPALL
jgi:hypothetical protein